MTSLVWLRDDLRVHDNPALHAAVQRGDAVVAVYVLDEVSDGIRALGGAAKWWLHHSLSELAEQLGDLGIPLILRRGAAAQVIPAVATDAKATAVYANRRYGGAEAAADQAVGVALRELGIEPVLTSGSLLFEPEFVRTGAGTPYAVFTAFWRACQQLPAPRAPLPAPDAVTAMPPEVAGDTLEGWQLLPRDPDWAGGLRERWQPGETAARERLDAFIADSSEYEHARDHPASEATSLLSPRLRWGELSPHTVWHAARSSAEFLTELGWREFAWHTLAHFPDLATRNLKPDFDRFEWLDPDPATLSAWQQGRTGVGLVDAGMRELWHTGFMHNRVRMVTASFLIKNLLIDWRIGEQWFWDTLVDADEASNPFNWQWVAGSGADAAPYFRIFNPELQAKKFDPDGQYVARWAADAASAVPIVDLGVTRKRALAAYQRMRETTS